MVFTVALLLFIPHIYWEIQNDYPSIRFQLVQRAGVFNPQHVLSYIGEQVGVTGPVVLLLFSILYKPKDQFQKTLKYTTIGIFIFFLISSFKEMVNVHWTAIAWPGMLCLAYLYIEDLKTNKRFITGILVFNLVIVIILRINFIGNIFQLSNFNDKNPRAMTAVLKEKSKGHPLVFMDMYNDPSYFMFYAQEDCFAVNDIGYKKTQFNYLPALESKLQGKTISLISSGVINKSSEEVSVEKGKNYFITVIPNFTSFSTGIKITAVNFADISASAESAVRITIENRLTARQQALLKSNGGYLLLTFTNNQTKQSFRYTKPLHLTSAQPFNFTFKAPAQRGEYSCIFSVMTSNAFMAGFNSNIYTCRVK